MRTASAGMEIRCASVNLQSNPFVLQRLTFDNLCLFAPYVFCQVSLNLSVMSRRLAQHAAGRRLSGAVEASYALGVPADTPLNEAARVSRVSCWRFASLFPIFFLRCCLQ